MKTYKHLLWFVPAVLIVALVMVDTEDTPTASLPSTDTLQSVQKQNQDVKQAEVQKVEELSLKNQNIKTIEIGKVEEPSLKNSDVKTIEIRKEEEQRLKKQDKFYAQQAKALASRYEETAKLVASRGGDPKPLLDAADYFEKEAR